MTNSEYPEYIDGSWVASDRDGHIAVFVTAGEGPVPLIALNLEHTGFGEAEERIRELPAISEANLIQSYAGDGSIDMHTAKRGVFVYDWSDVHRIESLLHSYERVAVPDHPMKLSALPIALAKAAEAVRFVDVTFATARTIDVRPFFTCVESEFQTSVLSARGQSAGNGPRETGMDER